jgi:hypothetical protein
MAQKQHYWFKAKRYGYGWSYPLTWQGWLVYAVCFGGFVVHFVLALPRSATQEIGGKGLLVIATSFIWLVVAIAFCYKKGEPARWRWGDKT